MPSVEELLSVAEVDANTRSAMDSRIEIDADTRIIRMMPQDELFGVESDEKSERKYFKVHKIVGNGVDLSKLQLRINYQNASKIPSGKDMYIVTDATVYNDEWVYFSWELSRKVTQYKGSIYFIVCAIKADSNGNITNEWNTTLAEGKVLEGLEVETSQEQQYQASDYLEQLKQQLLDYSKEIKDTFPSDYTQIQDDIGSLKSDLDTLNTKEKRISFQLNNGDISQEDGSIISSTTYGITDLIDVKYVVNNYIRMESGVAVYIAQYAEDDSYISIKKYSEPSLIKLEPNAKYVRLNSKLTNVGKFYISYMIASVKDMQDRFGEIANIAPNLSVTTDVFDRFIPEKRLDNGIEVSDPNWSTTDFIYAKLIDCSEFTINNDSCVVYISCYDKNKLYLEDKMITTDSLAKLRADCKYVRIYTRTNNITSHYFDIQSVVELVTAADISKEISKKCTLSLKTTLDFGAFGDNGEYVRSTYKKVTPRYIKVNKYTQYKPIFIGNLFCYEYDIDKKLVSNGTLISDNSYSVNKRTEYIRFASDHNPNWDGVVEFENLKQIEFAYNEREGYETLPFIFQFYGNKGLDYDGSNVDVDTKPYYTGALLRLPPNYSSVGDKVPLIYFAHGSGDYSDRNETEFSKYYMDYIQYLQDEGHAIIDVNGNTSKYTTTGACQWGNPTNMAAIKQGIKWVCRNYNVDINRIYVMSKSLGGLQAINMCYENDMHIKACCPLAPELDMICDGLGYYPNERKNNADDLGFSEDVNNVLDTPYDKSIEKLYKKSEEYKQYIRDNATKLLGHNPAWRGVIGISASEMVEYPIQGDYTAQGQQMSTQNRFCIVPTKIFIAQDDTAVSYEMSKGYIQSLKNGGCVGELRTMPSGTGGHHAVDNDENALKVDTITTYCGVVHHDVPLAYVEVVQFFKRYS